MNKVISFKIPLHQVEYFKQSADELGVELFIDSRNQDDVWVEAHILGGETSLVGLSFNAGMIMMQKQFEGIVEDMKEKIVIDTLSRISSSNQNPTA